MVHEPAVANALHDRFGLRARVASRKHAGEDRKGAAIPRSGTPDGTQHLLGAQGVARIVIRLHEQVVERARAEPFELLDRSVWSQPFVDGSAVSERLTNGQRAVCAGFLAIPAARVG